MKFCNNLCRYLKLGFCQPVDYAFSFIQFKPKVCHYCHKTSAMGNPRLTWQLHKCERSSNNLLNIRTSFPVDCQVNLFFYESLKWSAERDTRKFSVRKVLLQCVLFYLSINISRFDSCNAFEKIIYCGYFWRIKRRQTMKYTKKSKVLGRGKNKKERDERNNAVSRTLAQRCGVLHVKLWIGTNTDSRHWPRTLLRA